MKKCKNCGALFTDDVSFCSECGESLGGKRVPVEKKKLGCGRVFLIFVGLMILFLLVVFIIGRIDDARESKVRATETSIAKTEAMRITETWIGEGRPTHTPTNTATITPIPSNTPIPTSTPVPTNTPVPTDAPAAIQPKQSSSSAVGVDPDLKAFMDSYESFMDEYVAFMQSFDSSSSSLSALTNYAAMMSKYADFAAKAGDLDTDAMSAADYAYYMEVMARVNAKMLTAAY